MKISYHKKFQKRFKKMPLNLRDKVVQTIEKFVKNPFHPSLNNHQLTGKMAAFRSISITGDARIIFQEFDHYTVVVMLNVGGHNEVYNFNR